VERKVTRQLIVEVVAVMKKVLAVVATKTRM
jgi:hypothetical protein